MSSTVIGSWQLPSGNRVDITLKGHGRLQALQAEWKAFPPSRSDLAFYEAVVMPEVSQRLREYHETTGVVLWAR